jgi:hypothetical protein
MHCFSALLSQQRIPPTVVSGLDQEGWLLCEEGIDVFADQGKYFHSLPLVSFGGWIKNHTSKPSSLDENERMPPPISNVHHLLLLLSVSS